MKDLPFYEVVLAKLMMLKEPPPKKSPTAKAISLPVDISYYTSF
jgi:hypothetical protein